MNDELKKEIIKEFESYPVKLQDELRSIAQRVWDAPII